MPRLLLAALFLAMTTIPASASDGRLDENGCHYERKKGNYHCHEERPPNPDRFAPVKKSRENICHDKSSPNYRTTRYFVAYANMRNCIFSGGREAIRETGGLADKAW
jgi:hypothetical protein